MTAPVVLITGASSGIGRALAKFYAKKGFHQVWLARRESELISLQNEILSLHPSQRVEWVSGDVTQQSDVDKAVQTAKAKFGRIDTVIANAGVGKGDPLLRANEDELRWVYEVNVFGVWRTLKSTIPDVKKSRGKLAVIGSVNSYLGLPNASTYCSSKFAVKGMCDALRAEMIKDHVSVTLICPGLIESEIRLKDEKGKITHSQDPAPRHLVMSADTAAKQIFNAIETRKPETVITAHGKILVWLTRYFPGVSRYLATKI